VPEAPPPPAKNLDWPDDDNWPATARVCADFRLDGGYGVSKHVPMWMLPVGGAGGHTVAVPDIPSVVGHVLTGDAVGHEDELIRYFTSLPKLPDPALRIDTIRFHSLDANVLICPSGEWPIVADMFNASIRGARELLGILASDDPGPTVIYDNLDQGWALRILLRPEAVYVLDWNPDADDDGAAEARALRLDRAAAAEEARAALERLDRLHPRLVAAVGIDLWAQPAA
jgi:hypothetical protein